MDKKIIGGIVLIIVVGSVGFFLVKHHDTSKSQSSGDTSTSMTNMNQQTNSGTNNPVTTNKVDIKNFAFSPATITVKKGTTVTWTNQDATKHSVVPDDETQDFKASQLLGQGETYTTTFNTTGTFTYHCGVHPDMKATVVVTE